MNTRNFAFVLAAALLAGPAQAEPLVSWLHHQIDEAFVRSTVDEEFRLALHAAAEEHASGYEVADLDECRLQTLETLIPRVMRERRSEAYHANLPGPDAQGYFTEVLLKALHRPVAEPVDPETVSAQIDGLVDAMLAGLQEHYPGAVDSATAEELRERWAGGLGAIANDCLNPAFKVSLDEAEFDALATRVRSETVSDGHEVMHAVAAALSRQSEPSQDIDEASVLQALADPAARSEGLREMAGEDLTRRLRSVTRSAIRHIERAYTERAREVFGDAVMMPEELKTELASAGLDHRVTRYRGLHD